MKCIYQRKGVKGYFCKCARDGSMRKYECWDNFLKPCPYFKAPLIYRLIGKIIYWVFRKI